MRPHDLACRIAFAAALSLLAACGSALQPPDDGSVDDHVIVGDATADVPVVDADPRCPSPAYVATGVACSLPDNVSCPSTEAILDCNGDVAGYVSCPCSGGRWNCFISPPPHCVDAGPEAGWDAGSDGGHSCTWGAPCSPGEGCATSGPCPTYCTCSADGTFQCEGPPCVDSGLCPPTVNPGQECSEEGLSCNGPEVSCPGQPPFSEPCTCSGGRWTCPIVDCPPPPVDAGTCPVDVLPGTACSEYGAICPGPGTPCGPVSCFCGPSGSWACTPPPDCTPVDAGDTCPPARACSAGESCVGAPIFCPDGTQVFPSCSCSGWGGWVCGAPSCGGTVDAGPPPPWDGGVPPPWDGGVPPPWDAGVPPPWDGGFPTDTGVPSDGGDYFCPPDVTPGSYCFAPADARCTHIASCGGFTEATPCACIANRWTCNPVGC